MEETKTAEEKPKDLITPNKIDWNAAGSEEFKVGGHFVYAEMLPHIEYYKNQLTQHQSANAELKKQNEELVEALKESLIDQNARYNILMIKALNSNEQNPEKTMYGEEAAIVLKRMKATQKIVRKHTA